MANKTLAENVAQVKADFKGIRDELVNKGADIPSGTPTSEYANIIKDLNPGGNTEEAFEQGKQAQRLEWWGEYLGQIKASGGANAFYGVPWNDETFDPPFDIELSNGNNMFYASRVQDVRGIMARNNVRFIFNDTNPANIQFFTLFQSSRVKYLPYLKLPTTSSAYGWFYQCRYLVEVDGYECAANHTFETSSGASKTFQDCTALEHIIFHGTIAKKLDIHWSKKIDRASILSLLTCLNATVSGIVITLPSMCIDGATDTLALIQGDTELNTAYTQALAKGYVIEFA